MSGTHEAQEAKSFSNEDLQDPYIALYCEAASNLTPEKLSEVVTYLTKHSIFLSEQPTSAYELYQLLLRYPYREHGFKNQPRFDDTDLAMNHIVLVTAAYLQGWQITGSDDGKRYCIIGPQTDGVIHFDQSLYTEGQIPPEALEWIKQHAGLFAGISIGHFHRLDTPGSAWWEKY